MNRTYDMQRFEVMAPGLHAKRMRDALQDAGFSGWTEWPMLGFSSRYETESGTVFVIYTSSNRLAALCAAARKALPDQRAIQIVDCGPVQLIEA